MEAGSTQYADFSDREHASIKPTEAVHADHLTEEEKQMRAEELAFYSHSSTEHGDDNIWGLLSGVGGNIYEW